MQIIIEKEHNKNKKNNQITKRDNDLHANAYVHGKI